MKLLRARFENFRLLRDLTIDFSVDADKKLTVIRAENETGKTTILTALQWAFYGDDGLPGTVKTYRLHPIDWQQPSCSIVVEVDFEVSVHNRLSQKLETKIYRLSRSAIEQLKGAGWERSEPILEMHEMQANGSKKVDHAENRVRTELPPQLREVFFTDGDRALSFIEADSSTVTRQRVESAIKALLGLSIIEEAERHVKSAAADVNRKVKETNVSQRAREASERIEQLDGDILMFEREIAEASDARIRSEEAFDRMNKQIEAALKAGDRAELGKELENIRTERKNAKQRELTVAREMAELLKDRLLARQLLSSHVEKASGILERLKDEGRIPFQTIPVLLERLRQGVCICGEDLNSEAHDAERRRQHIGELVQKSRAADAMQSQITELYYGAQDLMSPVSGDGWRSAYASHFARRQESRQVLEDLSVREAQAEAKVAAASDVDIQAMTEQRRVARRSADDQNTILSRARTRLEAAKEEHQQVVALRDKYMDEESKGDRLRSELQVSQDVLDVLARSMARLKSDELNKVSDLMNDIFLEMIGADPAQGAIIKRASVSREFDIIVWGPDQRLLNPDRDLNGASRRALTIAFILALTQVSEVEAPNIIDTPLGMMSGYVKSSVLRSTIAHSSQLILFLTRSEIAGTEDILKDFAGKVTTLTNPAHYPRMLKHKPPTTEMRVIGCDCSYDESCDTCARHMDVKRSSDVMESV
ncbi:AAA family ATPase [Agrobacterium tumefaciens]|uniref:AAA family ATPase n=1 Tax=Agrobacterium tumefaciens TaxID=358 RepID=UPI00097872A3|nr:hypothetical protein BV900_14865 [Agrobacterium tumefaciens]